MNISEVFNIAIQHPVWTVTITAIALLILLRRRRQPVKQPPQPYRCLTVSLPGRYGPVEDGIQNRANDWPP